MRLNLVPASQGIQWIKLGLCAFRKQPLALFGLFLLFSLILQLLAMVPVIGIALALALLPAATLGFMSATREAAQGRFPMPAVLLSAFRSGPQRLRAMLLLGLLYALVFALSMGIVWLVDGGEFIRVLSRNEALKLDELQRLSAMLSFQMAVLVACALNMVLAMLFWHAPALVHWHDVTPVKSLFFSLVACLRNFKAFFVYGLGWTGLILLVMLVASLLVSVLGAGTLQVIMPFATMLITALLFTSQYFSYVGCFENAAAPTPNPDQDS